MYWFVSSIHPSRTNIVIWPFSFWTCTYLKDFVEWMGPSVTHICQGGILSLNHFCFTDLHLFKGFCLADDFVSNIHPSRQNLVT